MNFLAILQKVEVIGKGIALLMKTANRQNEAWARKYNVAPPPLLPETWEELEKHFEQPKYNVDIPIDAVSMPGPHSDVKEVDEKDVPRGTGILKAVILDE